jgi:uncharacterized protein
VDLVVKVERIPERGLDLAGHLDAAELQHSLNSEGDTGLTTPAGGDVALHFERIDQAVRITGHLDTAAVGTCSRCLGPARLALAANVDVTLFPAQPTHRESDAERVVADTGAGDDDPLADLDTSGGMSGTFQDGRIDAGAILREVLLLELPIQLLCQESCAGLCDQCGQNLNLGPCGCVREHVDPRWEGLKSVKVP